MNGYGIPIDLKKNLFIKTCLLGFNHEIRFIVATLHMKIALLFCYQSNIVFQILNLPSRENKLLKASPFSVTN